MTSCGASRLFARLIYYIMIIMYNFINAPEQERNMSSQSHGTALISGASSGIGATYAERLARRGYDVILVARDQPRLDGLASRIRTETGVSVETVRADLTVQADVLRVEGRMREDEHITRLPNSPNAARERSSTSRPSWR